MDDATVLRGYLPGKREATAFVALAVAGLVAWAFSTPSVAGLLDERFYRAAYSFPFYFGLIPYASLALLAGFLFLKGFWLWGAALFRPYPFAYAALAWWQEARGADVVGDGAGAAVGSAVVLATIALGSAVVATAVSALGAALRVSPRALGALRERRSAGGDGR